MAKTLCCHSFGLNARESPLCEVETLMSHLSVSYGMVIAAEQPILKRWLFIVTFLRLEAALPKCLLVSVNK